MCFDFLHHWQRRQVSHRTTVTPLKHSNHNTKASAMKNNYTLVKTKLEEIGDWRRFYLLVFYHTLRGTSLKFQLEFWEIIVFFKCLSKEWRSSNNTSRPHLRKPIRIISSYACNYKLLILEVWIVLVLHSLCKGLKTRQQGSQNQMPEEGDGFHHKVSVRCYVCHIIACTKAK